MQVEKPDSPAPSCVSIKSGQSIEHPVFFKDGDTSVHGSDCQNAEVRNKLKSDLKTKFQCLYEGIEKQGTPTFLNEIYTEPCITEGGGINNEHEISSVEKASRKATAEDTPINCNDIFKPLQGQNQPIRTVLTKGVAGIGKTVSVQKFVLDWAEGKANQDVHLIFPLPFRELNMLKDKTFSLKDLLQFFMGTKQLEISPNECKTIFIFDGLDECRLSLDFQNNIKLCDVTESASVDVLLTNLIVGNLLPSALIWITSRPAAADLVPPESVDRVTEVRGFSDQQKEEYFRKRIRDQSLANQIISHLKSSRSLYIMCYIPVFCWISATVLEKMLSGEESGEIPKTLTQMYTHFLILQTNIKHEKDYEKKLTDEEMILKLGKLAFQELMKRNVIFYEEDLKECGIDVTEASVYSGLCTQIFREEFGLCQRKVYCFVHLSIQEHLAALYVWFSFSLKNVDVLSEYQALKYNVQSPACFTIYERAVEEALQSDHTLENEIQEYLSSGTIRDAVLSPSQWSALVFVLLTSEQLEEFELKKYIKDEFNQINITQDQVLHNLLPVVEASRSAQLGCCSLSENCSADLASVLGSEFSCLRELNLNYNHLKSSGVKLLCAGLRSPHCKLETLWLWRCDITDEGFAALAFAMNSNPSHLRELDLSENNLGDQGMKLFSDALKCSQCKLETLKLRLCNLSNEGCAALTSALRSNPSHLRELDLSENELGDAGVQFLSDGLRIPLCNLEILWLKECDITDEGCAALASALRSNPSHMKELDLSNNKLTETGTDLLTAIKFNPHYKLEKLHNASPLDKFREEVQSNLRSSFQCFHEGKSTNSAPIPLNEIYTELYITEGGSGEINNEHEIRWIETAFRRRKTEDTQINLNDIFKPLHGQNQPIRTVLTKGVAGIGKTVSVQKFILDWAEGKENQDVHLIFPLPFRELNLLKDKTFSLKDLLQFFMGTKQLEISPNEGKIIFIFDGLDECRLSLDFQNNIKLCDVTESASVDVLLTNLVVGNLLPSALIWITSRPAAADLVPSDCVDRVTEVRGFSDPQKEEYFRKRIRDQSLANKIISHLKSSRSLYIMCHIPVFCWISATVLEKMLCGAESGEIPKTLTQMYTHFLILQINFIREKHNEKKVKAKDMVLKLGKLAYQQLEKHNLIFYEEDLREFGIDVQEAAVYSGLCTQIFREESGLFQGKVCSFVHLSVQEHLAALYVYLSFVNVNTNELDQPSILPKVPLCVAQSSLFDLHQRAVKKALQSTSGHLDLFLSFLLGLSLESNQTLLQGLLSQTEDSSDNKERIVTYIKGKIKENLSPEKLINLFHCLNELNDNSLVEEIQHYLKSGSRINTTLTASQWSAMVFVLLTSGQKLDVFDLNEYIGTQVLPDECLQRLQPVLEASRTAVLESCGVSDKGCTSLALALRSNPSHLKELDLSGNKISNSGLKILSAELQNPLCKLEKLWMRLCGVTDEGCDSLALFLKSNPSHLRGLNLSGNKLGDLGMKNLADGLGNPHCTLEILRLRDCGITDEGCVALASALRSNPSHLKELDLSGNKLRNIGVKRLSVLKSHPLSLRELDLGWNKLGDSGVQPLFAALENPNCKLKVLRLRDCKIAEEGCDALASTLKSNPSHLRELDLSQNKLRTLWVKMLCTALEKPECNLEILRLEHCGLTDKSCAVLASALRSNPSHLRELDLYMNNLGDTGRQLLSALKDDPNFTLQKLQLQTLQY
ncbi:NLR family CARD domain-containing protein 3 [Anabarilius grahami]|uniref:NLR family CARD domain-containing protein 3 n=1 Tax=Anabarilius grahami TaxID=495550 RepID=A0A3N0YG06_ANAGA|nr:NLR family CARD domain-containing protein 3 [Anabarilius grahami]